MFMYIYTYIYIHMYVYINIYAYMYIHTHKLIHIHTCIGIQLRHNLKLATFILSMCYTRAYTFHLHTLLQSQDETLANDAAPSWLLSSLPTFFAPLNSCAKVWCTRLSDSARWMKRLSIGVHGLVAVRDESVRDISGDVWCTRLSDSRAWRCCLLTPLFPAKLE